MSKLHGAALGLGTNLGDRLGNLLAAIRCLKELDIQVTRLSRLYESAAAYVTDQPPFLNAAALVETTLQPLDLLKALKDVERDLGRVAGGQRWGPRPIDLDIIFYEGRAVEEEGGRLLVPHPRWGERDFVTAPLADLWRPAAPGAVGAAGAAAGAGKGGGLAGDMAAAAAAWAARGGEAALGSEALRCVVPMGRLGLWPWQGRSQVMGVLNVTPDSFSDGGAHSALDAAVAHGRRLAAEGADIIDVGGQSTRPGSKMLPPGEEVARVVPVIRALASDPATASLPLSVDTFYGEVAEAAVAAGATLVNDVSAGWIDPGMLPTVARLGVPYVLMHMRGTPGTMQAAEHTAYADVAADVAAELRAAAERAVAAGIEPWRLLLDPGIGFAKTGAGNLQIIAELGRLREGLGPPFARLPLLVGPSRKGFLGALTGRAAPAERDHATAAAAALCVAQGANVVRAHNVGAVRDAVRVADAVGRYARGAAALTAATMGAEQ